MDERIHEVGRWDLAICHPPCTHLAVSGARHFANKKADNRQKEAISFFMKMFQANADRIAVENPVCIMSTEYRKPDQIIQPYEFGHPHRKTTCLWLVNLPKLTPTNVVEVTDIREFKCKDGKTVRFSDWINHAENGDSRAKTRSKTFQGVADAMADQWGKADKEPIQLRLFGG